MNTLIRVSSLLIVPASNVTTRWCYPYYQVTKRCDIFHLGILKYSLILYYEWVSEDRLHCVWTLSYKQYSCGTITDKVSWRLVLYYTTYNLMTQDLPYFLEYSPGAVLISTPLDPRVLFGAGFNSGQGSINLQSQKVEKTSKIRQNLTYFHR